MFCLQYVTNRFITSNAQSYTFQCHVSDLPIEKIEKCMGDSEANTENEVLKIEQEVQVCTSI